MPHVEWISSGRSVPRAIEPRNHLGRGYVRPGITTATVTAARFVDNRQSICGHPFLGDFLIPPSATSRQVSRVWDIPKNTDSERMIEVERRGSHLSFSERKLSMSRPNILIDGYNSHGTKTVPPEAAKFGRGATNIEQFRQATELRRLHNAKLSDPARRGWQKQSPNS
jgi:hypothetical protein